MIELIFSALITILPNYLYRHHRQGKRLGQEITLYNFRHELRWGITCCILLATTLLTVIFYYHPTATNVTSLFRTVSILSDRPGRVETVYISNNQRVSAGDPIFSLDTNRQRAAAETSRRRIAEVEAETDIAKATVFAGTDGTVKQLKLKPSDIVNPILRPAGMLVPEGSGVGRFQAGFGQVTAQVVKPGMLMEITCASKPLVIIPMVVTEIQGAIAGGLLRPSDQLIDIRDRARPGTGMAVMEPLFDGHAEAVLPGSTCLGVAYTSRAREIAAGEITGLRAFVTALVDGMGIANAFVLRIQAILLPVKVLVFTG